MHPVGIIGMLKESYMDPVGIVGILWESYRDPLEIVEILFVGILRDPIRITKAL